MKIAKSIDETLRQHTSDQIYDVGKVVAAASLTKNQIYVTYRFYQGAQEQNATFIRECTTEMTSKCQSHHEQYQDGLIAAGFLGSPIPVLAFITYYYIDKLHNNSEDNRQKKCE